MSDYTQITDFSAKDALPTGNSEKIILGADVDAEFAAIATAISSKYDSDDIASEAQAEALALNTVLLTPLRLDNVMKDNAGIVSDLQALSSPGADRLLMWDNSDSAAEFATLGSGISISTNSVEIDHDTANNFVANEHINHTSVDITAGNGLTGGGDISSSRTLNVGAGNGITVNANDVALADAAASTANPIDVSSGSIEIDLTALTTITGSSLLDADRTLIDDNGTPKAMRVDEVGLRVTTDSSTSRTLDKGDNLSIIRFTNAGAVTVTINDNVHALGNVIVLKDVGSGGVSFAGTAALEGISTSGIAADGTVTLICTAEGASTVFSVAGDVA